MLMKIIFLLSVTSYICVSSHGDWNKRGKCSLKQLIMLSEECIPTLKYLVTSPIMKQCLNEESTPVQNNPSPSASEGAIEGNREEVETINGNNGDSNMEQFRIKKGQVKMNKRNKRQFDDDESGSGSSEEDNNGGKSGALKHRGGGRNHKIFSFRSGCGSCNPVDVCCKECEFKKNGMVSDNKQIDFSTFQDKYQAISSEASDESLRDIVKTAIDNCTKEFTNRNISTSSTVTNPYNNNNCHIAPYAISFCIYYNILRTYELPTGFNKIMQCNPRIKALDECELFSSCNQRPTLARGLGGFFSGVFPPIPLFPGLGGGMSGRRNGGGGGGRNGRQKYNKGKRY